MTGLWYYIIISTDLVDKGFMFISQKYQYTSDAVFEPVIFGDQAPANIAKIAKIAEAQGIIYTPSNV